ncbi:MAG TPA: RagB/SusD family nutrient uptake outer membrane protein, partial [Hymenobacter sp.]
MQDITYIIARKSITAGAFVLLLGASSCSFFNIEEVKDPNNEGIDAVLANASQSQINGLAVGTEASMRLGFVSGYDQVVGTLGREVIVLNQNESRWYTTLLGTRALDNTAFYNAVYPGFARAGRAARIFRQSADNATTAVLTDAQKQGVRGFTHTVEAFSKLYQLNLMGTNGIRVDVENYLSPGPFVTEAEALTNIKQLLDQGATELDAAGATFGFTLSAGYAGFNTPATYKRFNRALAARVDIYRKDWASALQNLGQSFYNPTGDLFAGPKLVFNPGSSNDAPNPDYQPQDFSSASVVTVQKNFVSDAEPNDARVPAKVHQRTTPRVLGGLSQSYEPVLYKSQTDPIGIIRNEELILISAEAHAQRNELDAALADINVVRTRSGRLPALPSGLAQAKLIRQVLKQRRYSLFYEGQRLVDVRRYGLLDSLPKDLPTHKVY